MKRHVFFSVPGAPVGKARARNGNGWHYTPKRTREYEQLVFSCFKGAYPCFKTIPAGTPVAVSITAYYPIAKSDSKKVRYERLLGKRLPSVRPDIDNVIKAILDALQGEDGAYTNDSQVCCTYAQKFYSDTPRVDVEIDTVERYTVNF